MYNNANLTMSIDNVSCCDIFSGISIESLLDKMDGVDKTKLEKTYEHFMKRDNQFLYFIIIVYATMFIISLFEYGISGGRAGLVIASGIFALFMSAFRVYLFKLYLQYPVIAIFSQYESNCTDISMNLWFIFMVLILVGLFVAMFFEILVDTTGNNGVILMCFVMFWSICTTGWYRAITTVHIVRAYNKILNNSASAPLANARLVNSA